MRTRDHHVDVPRMQHSHRFQTDEHHQYSISVQQMACCASFSDCSISWAESSSGLTSRPSCTFDPPLYGRLMLMVTHTMNQITFCHGLCGPEVGLPEPALAMCVCEVGFSRHSFLLSLTWWSGHTSFLDQCGCISSFDAGRCIPPA